MPMLIVLLSLDASKWRDNIRRGRPGVYFMQSSQVSGSTRVLSFLRMASIEYFWIVSYEAKLPLPIRICIAY